MNPKYPVYIISKGRWESRLTAKALDGMHVPYHIVIEPQEYEHYAAVIDPEKIYVLPFSNLGQGSIPARNWVWEHAIASGAERHWILDDNIHSFQRLYKNTIYYMGDGTGFRVIEDFVDRYTNVPMAGMQYKKFAPKKQKHPPMAFNTRVYSCILLTNNTDLRWRGRYNEDTDLSLRFLKQRDVTVLFYAFLAEKVTTMTMSGGNSDQLYQDEGRLKMAQSLVDQHPDVARITYKWGRWQHHVDYRPFKSNKLIRRPGVDIPDEPNDYGLTLKDVR